MESARDINSCLWHAPNEDSYPGYIVHVRGHEIHIPLLSPRYRAGQELNARTASEEQTNTYTELEGEIQGQRANTAPQANDQMQPSVPRPQVITIIAFL